MTRWTVAADEEAYDVLGVGFGPANMALAVLLEEEAEAGRGMRRLFVEARPELTWHPGMLIEGSLLQISVLKDLALVRDPTSRFTFLNYLKENDRLYEFLNLRDLFPGREEFSDYLRWVGGQLTETVRYGRRVETVRAVEEPGGEVVELEVVARDGATGEEERYRTRNVVVATGGRPWTPDGVELAPDGRAFHTQEFKQRLERDFPDRNAPYRFAVVGAGQSGAEIFLHLLTRYPNATVTAAMRRFGYKPVDESDFTNTVFFPSMVDFVYDLPDGKRREVVDSFRDVNYAVVDLPLIRRIYRFLYDEKVAGRERGRILSWVELESIEEGPEETSLLFRHRLEERSLRLPVDGAVIATGYDWPRRHPLLSGLASWFEDDGDGGWRVERDYSLSTPDSFRANVFLQGYCESTHGISETVLSLLPVRAGDIARSLHASREELGRVRA